jgi:hypothetical protein
MIAPYGVVVISSIQESYLKKFVIILFYRTFAYVLVRSKTVHSIKRHARALDMSRQVAARAEASSIEKFGMVSERQPLGLITFTISHSQMTPPIGGPSALPIRQTRARE